MDGYEQHWACAECSRKCSKIHGRWSPPIRLSFFKIMLGQFKKSLIVPPKFARLLGNLVGESFYFEVLNERRWEVKLSMVDDHLAFQQGWNEFVSYHSIQVGEILVFKYVGTSNFIVQIFGTSGCERSLFCEVTDDDMYKRCTAHCSCFCKDERKYETCKAHCCIGDKVTAKKRKLIGTIHCESFSSPVLCCESDGDFNKRKRPDTECLCKHPREDGGKFDKSTFHCCTKDKDSTRKRRAIRTTPCEILSALKCGAKDTRGDSNDAQKYSFHNMSNNSGPQTSTAVNYSELPCIIVSEDQEKGLEESQMFCTDGCANWNVSPVSENAERGQEVSQIVPTDSCPNGHVSRVDCPELPCKLSNTDSGKEQKMILALPSEFISTKVGIENVDKFMIVEEKSSYHTNSKMSQNSCDQKLKGNKYDLPIVKNIANINNSLTERGGPAKNCFEVPHTSIGSNSSKGLGCKNSVIELSSPRLTTGKLVPVDEKSAASKDGTLDKAMTDNNFVSSQSIPSLKCSGAIETNSSKELSCKNLVIKLSNPGLSNEKVMLEEDTSLAAQDSILDKGAAAKFVSSQSIPSLKCIGDVVEDLIFCDMATHKFLVDEEGTCYIVPNLVANPGSNNTSTNLSKSDMDNAICEVSFAPKANEISFCCDVMPKDISLAPIFQCRNGESSNDIALIDTTNNGYHAGSGLLNNMGNNAPAIPEENDAPLVQDGLRHMTKTPKSQEGSNTMSGSSHEHGAKYDAVSQQDVENFKPYLKEAVLKVVKTEIMDPDDLSSPNATYFSFSLVVNTLSWHELSEPLPSNCGKWRLEKKVVLLRDPSMRVWPVLYHESLRFTGFLGGWEAFVVANNIQKGDTCHFETASRMEPMLQVQISSCNKLN